MTALRSLALAALLVAACKNPAQPAIERWRADLGCGAEAELTVTRALEEARLRVTGENCRFRELTAHVDMPGMPMAVAPVALEPVNGAWEGVIVFTMAGPWYVELKAVDAQRRPQQGRHDLSVP